MTTSPLHAGLVGQPVAAIDSPTLVIDLDAMERNHKKMQDFAQRHNVFLRPHAKMHKSAELSKFQMDRGAVGVCVQKVSEAEALVNGGVTDIFISNEVIAPQKLEKVAMLAARLQKAGGGLSIAVDSVLGVERLGAAMVREGGECGIGVFIEVECGQRRGGTNPDAAHVLPIARAILERSSIGLRFAGIHAYHGSAQHIRSYSDRQTVTARTAAFAKAAKDALSDAGIAVPLVTGGGTGTFSLEATSGVYNEIQPGSYLVWDRDYADNDDEKHGSPLVRETGGAGTNATVTPAASATVDHPKFEHALFLKTTVVSIMKAPRVDEEMDGGEEWPPYCVVDAGHKSHAIDTGMPAVFKVVNEAGTEERHFSASFSQFSVENGGDEHTILKAKGAQQELPFQYGDTVWLVPGHCDPTFNLHDSVVGIRGGLVRGVVEKIIKVDARGCSW